MKFLENTGPGNFATMPHDARAGTRRQYNTETSFLSRFSIPMHAERDVVIANLSVRLSVTRQYCTETNAIYRQTLSAV